MTCPPDPFVRDGAYRLAIISHPLKGPGVMPIPFLSRESPNLAIVKLRLIV